MPVKIEDLPTPPSGRSGWPWTEAPDPLPLTRTDGQPWPHISIVTPSYNQGAFIEETIRSVLLQGYPALTYVVIDGGSTDQSVAIIEKYSPWIDYWVSEQDRGQSHAINKGLAHCEGQLFNWLNSDDILLPGALAAIGAAYDRRQPDAIISGVTLHTDERGSIIRRNNVKPVTVAEALGGLWPNQPGGFLPIDLVENVGGLREEVHFAMDADLWVRLWASNDQVMLSIVNESIATYRHHDLAKTHSGIAPFSPDEFCLRFDCMRSWGLIESDNPLAQVRKQFSLPFKLIELHRQVVLAEVPQYFCQRIILTHSHLLWALRSINTTEEAVIESFRECVDWLAKWRAQFPGLTATPAELYLGAMRDLRRFECKFSINALRAAPTVGTLRYVIAMARGRTRFRVEI